VPPSISTHEKGLGSGREHEEHPLYRAEEGEEKPESPTIQPTGGLRHQTSAGVLSHQASGILHHQTSGMMHHQTSGMLHPGASGILHHQTSSIYASERSKASTSWQNPKAALSSAMRFFGLTSGINSASALDLAAEVFELALTICMATAPEIMSFVEAFSGEEKKALQRLCSTAKKVGLLGASSPKWNTPAPLSELARAFLTQENSASRGRSGSKDINPMTMNELRSASSLSLSSAVAAKGGKDMKDVKRQVTFDMEEQDKSSSGSGKTSLKRGGTGSRSNLGLDRSRSDLGRVLNLNRSASDLSCSSFTDFNKRNKGFNIASPEKMRPSFLDFLTSLEQRPHGTGHAGMGMGMGMGIGMDVQETGVQMVMDIAIPGVGGRAPLDTVSEAGMSYHSHFDAVFGSEGEEKETVQASSKRTKETPPSTETLKKSPRQDPDATPETHPSDWKVESLDARFEEATKSVYDEVLVEAVTELGGDSNYVELAKLKDEKEALEEKLRQVNDEKKALEEKLRQVKEAAAASDASVEAQGVRGSQDVDAGGLQDVDAGGLQEFLADESVAKLGMAFRGLPPGHAQVKSCAAGGWAKSTGIQVGDKIVSIDGKDLQRMSANDFKMYCKKRPLRFVVERALAEDAQTKDIPAAVEFVAEEGTAKLGVAFQGLPPGHLQVKMCTAGSWAESVGIQAGDQIVSIDGKDLQGMSADSFKTYCQKRPVRFLVQPAVVTGAQTKASWLTNLGAVHSHVTKSMDCIVGQMEAKLHGGRAPEVVVVEGIAQLIQKAKSCATAMNLTYILALAVQDRCKKADTKVSVIFKHGNHWWTYLWPSCAASSSSSSTSSSGESDPAAADMVLMGSSTDACPVDVEPNACDCEALASALASLELGGPKAADPPQMHLRREIRSVVKHVSSPNKLMVIRVTADVQELTWA